jgi:hypothetical protein
MWSSVQALWGMKGKFIRFKEWADLPDGKASDSWALIVWGTADPYRKLNPMMITAVGRPDLVGLTSQSGILISQVFDCLHRHGMGFSETRIVGREGDVDLVDCLGYLGACPHRKVIALNIAGISRGGYSSRRSRPSFCKSRLCPCMSADRRRAGKPDDRMPDLLPDPAGFMMVLKQ